MIEFSLPTNDPPALIASSYSLTTNEDTPISFNVYVNDPDFYELGRDGLMRVNISVFNGTVSLSSSYGGIYFLKGTDINSSDIQMVGSLQSINQSLNTITFYPHRNQDGTAQILISLSDEGYSGTGPSYFQDIMINVSINQVYELPKLYSPLGYVTINEDTTFNLQDINCSISIDVDPEYGWLQLIATATYGNFSFDGNTSVVNVIILEHSITINDTAQILSSYFPNVSILRFYTQKKLFRL